MDTLSIAACFCPLDLHIWRGKASATPCLVHPPISRAVQDAMTPSDATRAGIDATETAAADHFSKMHPCEGIFALGDCCADLQFPLPALAQVAEQQGKYLAAVLNKHAEEKDLASASIARHAPFAYRHLGSMASIGHKSAVLEVGESGAKRSRFSMLEGLGAWFAWRSAYLTRLGNFRKRIEVAGNWTLTLLFGRDTSRW